MPASQLPRIDEAMRHGLADAPEPAGTPIATLAERLARERFVWFFADMHQLPADLTRRHRQKKSRRKVFRQAFRARAGSRAGALPGMSRRRPQERPIRAQSALIPTLRGDRNFVSAQQVGTSPSPRVAQLR